MTAAHTETKKAALLRPKQAFTSWARLEILIKSYVCNIYAVSFDVYELHGDVFLGMQAS